MPAIGQLLESIPERSTATVVVEVADASGRSPLPHRSATTITWLERSPDHLPGTAMEDAVRTASIDENTHVWVAGEARAVQAIRRQLFEGRGLPRSRATVRGYWKHGRDGIAH